jgi:hypothetical protein
MTFELRRSTGAPDLLLAAEHAKIAAPRRGEIRWDVDLAAFDARTRARAADAWRARASQEFHSLALFTQISSQLHLLGAPLDWAGAFARMIADEVRHTELCARMAEACGGAPVSIDERALHLPVQAASLREHVRGAVVAAFCIGETISGRMFARCLRAATVPLAQDVVRAICVDEAFHGRFGWELGALLMRRVGRASRRERDVLAGQLPEVFAHYKSMCGADRGDAWARRGREAPPAPNFGTLTDAGYARAFYDGMEKDVVPGLVAIGLPEAARAWAEVK